MISRVQAGVGSVIGRARVIATGRVGPEGAGDGLDSMFCTKVDNRVPANGCMNRGLLGPCIAAYGAGNAYP